MEFDACVTILTALLALFSHGSVVAASPAEDDDLRSTLVLRMDDIQNQMSSVSSSMRALDDDIRKALVTCMGIHSDLCDALNAEVNSPGYARSRWAVSKHLVPNDRELDRARSLFHELGRKRAMVNHLLEVFDGADNVLKNERKRTCTLNLGFHCQTEEVWNFADIYDHLSSPKGPGKKRSVRSSP